MFLVDKKVYRIRIL